METPGEVLGKMLSPIAIISHPTEDEVSAMAFELARLENHNMGPANCKTPSNLLRAARIHHPAATPEQVAAFVAWKLQVGGARFLGWGQMFRAIVEDYGAWKDCRNRNAQTTGAAVPWPDERSFVLQTMEYLEELRKQVVARWPPINEPTTKRIVAAVRARCPNADPREISFIARDAIFEHHLRSWGGVVAAIRDNW
jgi:hypothetical protein